MSSWVWYLLFNLKMVSCVWLKFRIWESSVVELLMLDRRVSFFFGYLSGFAACSWGFVRFCSVSVGFFGVVFFYFG